MTDVFQVSHLSAYALYEPGIFSTLEKAKVICQDHAKTQYGKVLQWEYDENSRAWNAVFYDEWGYTMRYTIGIKTLDSHTFNGIVEGYTDAHD